MTGASVRAGRIEPVALAGVWIREWTVFRYYWRTRTFAAVVEPVIILLAFGLGFGRLVSHVGAVPYIEFVGTGAVATAVLFSAVFSAMFDSLYKRRYQRVYDAMLSTPIDVDELVTGEILFLGTRAGVYGVAPLLVAFCFGLPPRARDAARPVRRRAHRHRLRRARDAVLGHGHDVRRSELRDQRGDHAAVPRRRHVLPAVAPARLAAQRWRSSTRSITASSWSGTARSGCVPAPIWCTSRCWSRSRVLAWALAVSRTRARLID